MIPELLLGAIAVGAGAAYWRDRSCRHTLVVAGFRLREGTRYSEALDRVIRRADFTGPHGRGAAVVRLAEVVRAADVVDAFVHVRPRFAAPNRSGAMSEALARKHMERIGITPVSVNVAEDGTSVRHRERGDDGGKGASLDIPQTDACVLALVITGRATALRAQVSREGQPAHQALHDMCALPEQALDAMYVYFAPGPGDLIDPVTADRLYLDMKATAERA